MKKALKFLVPLLLGVLIIASIIWYLFIYDRAFTRDSLLSQARFQDEHGNSRLSAWFYDAAYSFSGHDENVAIELANQYKADGNYTKAELTLTTAITDAPTAELYTALSRVFVEQDKILDAVNMLDKLGIPEIKAQLDAARPAAPKPNKAPGYYSQYIDIQLDCPGAKYVFYTTDGEYPSIKGEVYNGSISLPDGETTIYAVSVNEDGLVSPVAVLGYTITGVIEKVTFEDPAMEAAIRTAIGADADDEVYTNQLWEVTEFTAPEGVTTYADLALLPDLTKLTIQNQTMDSLTHLSSLSKLVVLDLTGSKFPADELTVLASMPSLSSLTLANCNLSTIEGLENASNLTYLDLSSNTVRNLGVLTTMPALAELNLQHNAVTELSALSPLENLVKLDVSFNAIPSLSPLSSCIRLTWLAADNNQLTNLSGVEKLVLLQHLSVDYNQLTEISVLAKLTDLTNLSIASNNITDLSALNNLTKLQVFDFSSNQVSYLPQWGDGCALTTIDGSYNALQSIDVLKKMQSLTHVYMDYNLLTNIDALADCFCLVQVNVFGNEIPDVEALREHDIIVNYNPTVSAE